MAKGVTAQTDTDFLHGYTDFGWLNLYICVQIRVELGRSHPLGRLGKRDAEQLATG
jgi:hypothetical protein